MKLLIASGNAHKVAEIRDILGSAFDEVLSMKDAGIVHETVEDGATFEQNARKKADELCALSGLASLADDSGLCVDALNGAPGIYSARYAGEHGNDGKNNEKLLSELRGVIDRRAKYVCAMVIAFPDGRHVTAEGYMHGNILTAPRGNGGFGYDPLFCPDGYTRTVAELSPSEKNRISHRAAALHLLLARLGGESDGEKNIL